MLFNCQKCGKKFKNRYITNRYKRKYCSSECYRLSHIGKKLSKETIEKIRQVHIGSHRSEKTKKKMSEAKKGKHCGLKTEFKVGHTAWNKGKKGLQSMSKSAREKQRKAHLGKPTWNKGKKCPQYSGKEHWNWQGGISRDTHSLSHPQYKEWRLKVFTRDNFTCQGCQKVGGYLEGHHIKSWAKYPELRYVIENGITLCKECHKLTNNYGRPNGSSGK